MLYQNNVIYFEDSSECLNCLELCDEECSIGLELKTNSSKSQEFGQKV